MNAKPQPTERVRDAVNELLACNERTRGAVVSGRMFLGEEYLVVQLARPKIIEGTCEDVERTADIFDLMDAYQEEQESNENHLH